MAVKTQKFSLRRSVPSPDEVERRALEEELARTQVLAHQAYSGFNHTKDTDLIESYVYEINALQARYSYLLRRIKALETEP